MQSPPIRTTPRQRGVFIAATIGVVVLLAVAEGVQYYFQQGPRYGQHEPFGTVIAKILVPWFVLATLIPLVVLLVRAVPIDHARWWSVPAHFTASVAFGVAHLTVLSLVQMALDPPGAYPFRLRVLGLLQEYAFQDMVVYWGIVGALHALRYHRHALERERESLGLRESLGAARLAALRAQLHPHLLFNLLNTVSMLIRRGDNAGAVVMLADLGELLRELTRDAPATATVPLRDEIAFVRRYLALEQVRFGAQLRVVIDVDANAEHARVPSLLLQPLVENALRHGVARVAGPGQVDVTARLNGDLLRIEVRDSGPGVAADWALGNAPGIGLRNTVARLEQLYGSAFSFVLERAPAGGTASVVTLPYTAGAA